MGSLANLLNDYTFQVVALGSAALGIVSGVIGCFTVLRGQSLVGDGISHSALPGVVMAFLMIGSKNTEVLLLGAFISGLLAMISIVGIVRHTRIKFDSALALVLSVFFGLGMVLLSYVQNLPNARQAGLRRFIYGQASTMLQRDVVMTVLFGAVLLVLVTLLWKEFKLFSFDSEFAQILGFSCKKLNLLMTLITVAAIVIGLQTVGAILMSAMLIAPAVAARQWTNKLWVMVLLSSIFGAISGVAGTAVSSLVSEMPTGPSIVVAVSIIVFISILFAPGRGILHKLYIRRKRWLEYEAKGGVANVGGA